MDSFPAHAIIPSEVKDDTRIRGGGHSATQSCNCRRCFSHGGVFPRMGAAAEWVAGKANKVINSISL